VRSGTLPAAHIHAIIMPVLVEIAWMRCDSVGAPPEDFLSDAELQKLAQMRFLRRREEWLLGRWTAKRLLVAAVPALAGTLPIKWTISNEADGQPYVLIGDQRLAGCLSISHRGGQAVCAWTSAQGVGLGIDLERIEPRSPAFVSDYFTAAEQKTLIAGAARERDAVLVWSAKEAMLKALGKGLRLDTRAVEVVRIAIQEESDGWRGLTGRCPSRPDLDWWAGWTPAGEFLITLTVCGQALNFSSLHVQELRV